MSMIGIVRSTKYASGLESELISCVFRLLHEDETVEKGCVDTEV